MEFLKRFLLAKLEEKDGENSRELLPLVKEKVATDLQAREEYSPEGVCPICRGTLLGFGFCYEFVGGWMFPHYTICQSPQCVWPGLFKQERELDVI